VEAVREVTRALSTRRGIVEAVREVTRALSTRRSIVREGDGGGNGDDILSLIDLLSTHTGL